MGARGRLTVAILLGAVVAAAWLAVPRRFEVEGVSMGPAFLPGDLVRTAAFPALDGLRRPRRFDRWVLAATDGLALKRVVGLPGEEVSISDGDLAIDGQTVLKGPRLLAELGSPTSGDAADGAAAAEPGWAWSRPAGEVLDGAVFEPATPRRLAPVRDAGFSAVVDVRDAAEGEPAAIRLRIGDTVRSWPLTAPGRHAVVAGRLDGRLVVAAWPVGPAAGPTAGRSCLPAHPPECWQLADPWPNDGAGGDATPALAIGPGAGGRVAVVHVVPWRDVAWRAGADGRTSWRLGADDIFVLGDHPPASNDSRRWGPIRAAALRHRIVARAASAPGHVDPDRPPAEVRAAGPRLAFPPPRAMLAGSGELDPCT